MTGEKVTVMSTTKIYFEVPLVKIDNIVIPSNYVRFMIPQQITRKIVLVKGEMGILNLNSFHTCIFIFSGV